MPVPFGTSLPGVQQIPERTGAWERDLGGADMVRAAQTAERAGFAWVACSDHVCVPVSRREAMGATWYDAGSTLAFVAGATNRIGLLSHVLVAPYRHPLIVAKQYGTLDHLSGGRVILGVGSGHLKTEFKVLGANYDRRGLVTDEYIQAIAAAWEHDVAAFEGATVAFRDVMLAPRPARRPRPPIWVGGNARPIVRRAATLADGWVPWRLGPEEFATSAAYAREVRAASGRTEPLTLVGPMEVAPEATVASLLAQIAIWRRAGATAFHAGIQGNSLSHVLERIEWFGRDVIAHVE